MSRTTNSSFGHQLDRVSLGTLCDDWEFVSRQMLEFAAPLLKDYSGHALKLATPRNDFANGSCIFDMEGRSVFEGLPIGTGSEGDVGRGRLYGWKPVRQRKAAWTTYQQKIEVYDSCLWIRRLLADFTFTLGAVVAGSDVADGWDVDWSTVRLAKDITVVHDAAIDANGFQVAAPTDGSSVNDVAHFRCDAAGNPLLEILISRGDGDPSGGESGANSGNTSAPTTVGMLGTRL